MSLFPQNALSYIGLAAQYWMPETVELWRDGAESLNPWKEELENREMIPGADAVPARLKWLDATEVYHAGQPSVLVNVKVTIAWRADLATIREVVWNGIRIRVAEPVLPDAVTLVAKIAGSTHKPDS